ncbi:MULTISPECIES: DinB family protein [Flavobacterium]|uniref:DinB family protein n=1 Tax=Flavobacterium hankyongi TaxID=1176532 RepID=A0ABP8ZJL9_9FLAO|nr:DinB family protein [Flavobacterium sp. N1846]
MDFSSIKNSLIELKDVLNQLNNETFSAPILSLSNATIGEHTRHIIELYQAVLTAYHTGVLNYDDRERNKTIQENKNIALITIDNIIKNVEKEDKKLTMKHCISNSVTLIETNYFREILYNLEHCIHHQALIKVGLLSFNNITINETFGVAPSTLEFRKACAQ